jgi:hypothetical protein
MIKLYHSKSLRIREPSLVRAAQAMLKFDSLKATVL